MNWNLKGNDRDLFEVTNYSGVFLDGLKNTTKISARIPIFRPRLELRTFHK
jgi:hypothetical protein